MPVYMSDLLQIENFCNVLAGAGKIDSPQAASPQVRQTEAGEAIQPFKSDREGLVSP